MSTDTATTVDIHTHIYPPAYVALLRSRTTRPYITTAPATPSSPEQSRLIILAGDDDPSKPPHERGRPVGPDYWDIERKLAFMDAHGIDVSVISLANPWLDFLTAEEKPAEWARKLNDEVDSICAAHKGRLWAFGVLPLSGSVEEVVAEIHRLKKLRFLRGVVMGTGGLAGGEKGLDDVALEPVWAALEETGTMLFLHPHYGLPGEVYGPRANEYGHVLPLALGFPLETTIAVTRMYMAGVWDRIPGLEVLLAHSGGTLPFLAGRIESCVIHDGKLKREGRIEKRRSIWDVLKKNVYLDAVIYSEAGLRTAAASSGEDRVMFGTDHPFFPPLEAEETKWMSVTLNKRAIEDYAQAEQRKAWYQAIMGGNAVEVFNLDI